MRSALVLVVLLSAPPQALIDKHAEAFNRSDAAALAALYAEDGRVFSADGRAVRGRDEIEKFWRFQFSRQRRRVQLSPSETQMSGDIAYAIGGYSFTAPPERGTFTMCFKRSADGSWKIVSSMWNANAFTGYTPLVPL